VVRLGGSPLISARLLVVKRCGVKTVLWLGGGSRTTWSYTASRLVFRGVATDVASGGCGMAVAVHLSVGR